MDNFDNSILSSPPTGSDEITIMISKQQKLQQEQHHQSESQSKQNPTTISQTSSLPPLTPITNKQEQHTRQIGDKKDTTTCTRQSIKSFSSSPPSPPSSSSSSSMIQGNMLTNNNHSHSHSHSLKSSNDSPLGHHVYDHHKESHSNMSSITNFSSPPPTGSMFLDAAAATIHNNYNSDDIHDDDCKAVGIHVSRNEKNDTCSSIDTTTNHNKDDQIINMIKADDHHHKTTHHHEHVTQDTKNIDYHNHDEIDTEVHTTVSIPESTLSMSETTALFSPSTTITSPFSQFDYDAEMIDSIDSENDNDCHNGNENDNNHDNNNHDNNDKSVSDDKSNFDDVNDDVDNNNNNDSSKLHSIHNNADTSICISNSSFISEDMKLNQSFEIYNNDKNSNEEEEEEEENDDDKQDQIIQQLKTKIEIQSNTIYKQREELKRYDGMVKTYRNNLREKNLSLLTLEKTMNDKRIKENTQTQNSTSKSSKMDKNDGCNTVNTINDNNNNNNNNNAQSDQAAGEGLDCDAFTIQTLSCEIRTYQQIIASLTDENNNYRTKEVEYLNSISELEQNIHFLNKKVVDEGRIKDLESELIVEKQMIVDLSNQVGRMEEERRENQLQIAELGQKVLQLEVEINDVKSDKEILETLLAHSRSMVASLSNQKDRDQSLSDELDNNSVSNNTNCSYDALVISLQNELEATKTREQALREQLSTIMMTNDIDQKTANDSIMESLSESQQEAIVYLTGEVESLRTQLHSRQLESKKKYDNQRLEEKSKLDLIELLQMENKSFASKILKKEQAMTKIQEDLSMKLGQNACLRDEILELEEKATSMSNLITDLEAGIKEKDLQYNQLLLKVEELQALPSDLSAPPSVQSSPLKTADSVVTVDISTPLKSREGIFTVDMSGNQNLEDEDISVEGNVGLQIDATPNKLLVLKKALKRDYEKKLKTFNNEIKKKEEEMKELKRTTIETIKDAINDLNYERFNRISQEALFSSEIENLKTAVKEREHDLFKAHQKIRALSKVESGKIEESWDSRLSDTLIDGVQATIDMFESIKWPIFVDDDSVSSKSNNEMANSKFNERRSQAYFNLSSKSFG